MCLLAVYSQVTHGMLNACFLLKDQFPDRKAVTRKRWKLALYLCAGCIEIIETFSYQGLAEFIIGIAIDPVIKRAGGIAGN